MPINLRPLRVIRVNRQVHRPGIRQVPGLRVKHLPAATCVSGARSQAADEEIAAPRHLSAGGKSFMAARL